MKVRLCAVQVTTATVFNNCTKLKELIFNASTFHLSNTMFDGCSSLDRLTIYGNVISWPSGIFSNCGHLGAIDFKNATNVTIPGTDYINYDGTVIMLPTTLTTLKLGPLDNTVTQYRCGIRYSGTREDFKTKVTVTKTDKNIETKAQFNCYGESGVPKVYWKGYAAGTAGGHFVEYDAW